MFIFDFVFDVYCGVIVNICIMDGVVKVGDWIKMMFNGKEFEVMEVGVFLLKVILCDELFVGDVGYLIVVIKNVGDMCVGDIIIFVNNLVEEVLDGYCKLNLMVYCGLYLIDFFKYNDFCDVLEKLELNDFVL